MNESNRQPDIHRLLPQSPEAEQGVLSSLLLSPVEVAAMCAEKGITGNHFHIPAHGEVFRTIFEALESGKSPDFITLSQILKDRNKLDQVGGAGFITSLFTFLGTATNAEYYLGILQEKHVLREIIRVATSSAADAYDLQDETPRLLDQFEQQVLAIRGTVTSSRMASIKDLTLQAIGNIQSLYENRGKITGIETGFRELDLKLNGLQDTNLTVIAARPGYGKTAFAMNMVEHIAVHLKLPVAVFSLEMSAQQLTQRILSSMARVNLVAVRNGFLSERDFPAITAASAKLAASRLFIDDAGSATIDSLRAKARRMKKEKGIRVVVIDYLQLLRGSGRRAQDNRVLEISDISSGLKNMAKELGVPVVALAQLNRDVSRGPTRQPRLSDLREGGSIEQDADDIAFLRNYEKEAEDAGIEGEEMESCRGKAELIIAKQRNGETGRIPLTFLKEFTRFEDRAHK